MKKLTAGIFATILAVVGISAANADQNFIASKAYVDSQDALREWKLATEGTNVHLTTADNPNGVGKTTTIKVDAPDTSGLATAATGLAESTTPKVVTYSSQGIVQDGYTLTRGDNITLTTDTNARTITIDASDTNVTVDPSLNGNSQNPVANSAIVDALSHKADKGQVDEATTPKVVTYNEQGIITGGVDIVRGNDNVTIGTDASNNITISAKDTTYTAGANINIDNDTHEISATNTTYTPGDHITIDASNNNRISTTGLQDALTAGANVDISNGIISATDTTYTQGDNITIDANNKISATGLIPAPDPTSCGEQTNGGGCVLKAVPDGDGGLALNWEPIQY